MRYVDGASFCMPSCQGEHLDRNAIKFNTALLASAFDKLLRREHAIVGIY